MVTVINADKYKCINAFGLILPFSSKGHKDEPEGQKSFPKESAVSGRQSSPSRKGRDVVSVVLSAKDGRISPGAAQCRRMSCVFPQAVSQGHMRTVNSYAGFTEFDRNPSFLHPESSESAVAQH